jgi:hypothetical protein
MFDQEFDPGTYEAAVDAMCKAGTPTWHRLHTEMKVATLRRGAWEAQHARHLREAEELQLWKHFGCTSLVDYLEREHGIAARTALDRIRVARELRDLIVLESELEEGTFQICHVRELVRVMTPETEAEWIEAARGKTVNQVQQMIAGHKKGDGPDDPTDPDLRRRRIVADVRPTTLGMYRQARVNIEGKLGHGIEDEDDLWQILLKPHLEPETSPEPGAGASKPAQIWVMKCSECKRAWQDCGGVHAELSPEELACAECDGDQCGSLNDVKAGRKKVTLTAKRRKRIMARHNHRCAVPGCRATRDIDIHHIKHRVDGGTDDDWNCLPTCTPHHRMHHRGELLISGRAPDQVRFEWRTDDDLRAHVSTRRSVAC